MALQPTPLVAKSGQINAASAQKSEQLARRIVNTLKQNNSGKSQEIIVSQMELNGLAALLHRAVPVAKSDVSLSKNVAEFSGSVELPLPKFIRYFNITSTIVSSSDSLDITQVSIGRISVSGETFLSIVGWVADHFIHNQLVDKLLTVVTSVAIDENSMSVNLQLNNDVLALKNEHSLLFTLRDKLSLFGDAIHISSYYQSLSEFTKNQGTKHSIAFYIRYLFELARVRSNTIQNNAVDENNAAIMALIIYFGADRFETLVGDITNWEHDALVIRNRARRNVTLRGRVDLQKHFIYSMALQLFSTHHASDALGEYKEFLDSNNGGSGFSFADLQADRAGTRFAMIVTKSVSHAQHAQLILAKITDEQLLPDHDGLQEGIYEARFNESYRDVKSKKYQQTIKAIDAKLKALPLYRLGWN